MFKGTLRTKFLVSLVLISALLTSATLLLVRRRVQIHVRQEITQALRNSVATFQSLQQQRESTLERSAALLAALPPLKAVMTSRDTATIQDASATFWDLSGSQLFVLADRSGAVVAVHAANAGFTAPEAQKSLERSLAQRESRDWWLGGGRLFEVFLQPIYFGSPDDDALVGMLAVGYSVDNLVADDISRVASCQVAFCYQSNLVVSTVRAAQRAELTRRVGQLTTEAARPEEIQLGPERFLATSVRLSSRNSPAVTLTALKSYDEATAFLQNLNRWIVGVGVAGVLAMSLLVFIVSTTFTRPLAKLVAGVEALEGGNFAYPLEVSGNDEVSTLTATFTHMRVALQESQTKLLEAERLATIGRMASMISHDLRHPLTAILAYAEFLAEPSLSEAKRKDFFQEIRIAVEKMTDEIASLLGFSKQREALSPGYARVEEVIEGAIQTVKVLPEFETTAITFSHEGEGLGWFDARKLERVMLNLLFNACEASPGDSGRIEVTSRVSEHGIEIRVADQGTGIPESIRESLFQPFVSYGKAKGIGLGLTAVHKIMQDHGGAVSVESTGPDGTVLKLRLPVRGPAESTRQAQAGSNCKNL
jgi:signal transduction histidine kinase